MFLWACVKHSLLPWLVLSGSTPSNACMKTRGGIGEERRTCDKQWGRWPQMVVILISHGIRFVIPVFMKLVGNFLSSNTWALKVLVIARQSFSISSVGWESKHSGRWGVKTCTGDQKWWNYCIKKYILSGLHLVLRTCTSVSILLLNHIGVEREC